MGCAGSKQKRCRHCQTPYSPVPRSYSMHVHHMPQGKGDSYHVVALQSSTLGSLKLDSTHQSNIHIGDHVIVNGDHHIHLNGTSNGDLPDKEEEEEEQTKQFSMGLIEARTWSNMIEGKIPKPKVAPKTPIMTPPGEPETINTWELMEGLEDISPLRSPNHIRSFSFDFVRNSDPVVPLDLPKSRFQENSRVSPQPMWLQMADDNSSSKSIEFDPEIIATFRKSLQELPSDDPFYLRPLDDEKQLAKACNDMSLDVRDAKKVNSNDLSSDITDTKKVNGAVSDFKCRKDKVVVYFTSLRGVRKTYEDCCHVRVILKSLGLRVDERDVSMHSGFKEELKELLGDGFNGGGLPRVFAGKKYIGGAEEIRRLHEEGQLEKLLEGCEMVDDGGGGNAGACEACGDVRFVPCETCSGSCKVYYEIDEEEEEEEDEEEESENGEFGFQRCPDCNENGLIRCPICCY